MAFDIVYCENTPREFSAIASLLIKAFVEEGYADPVNASLLTSPLELRKRGSIILARSDSSANRILGMIIFVPPTSPARQVARLDESEIHLMAVDPDARGQRIASRLIEACEKLALQAGYKKMVLSTQPAMKAARRVYERAAYRRNPERDWSRPNGRSFLVYEKALT